LRNEKAQLIFSQMRELKISDIVVGSGTEVVKGAQVLCHYTGFFTDGKKFDSSLDRGRPFQFVIGSKRVIQGWDIGVMGMRVGGKRRLEVPSELGYGERAILNIPPHSDLVFEIEVLEVHPREK
jgi:FKBP-type peptidyl-prolyl cis-trans isomerase